MTLSQAEKNEARVLNIPRSIYWRLGSGTVRRKLPNKTTLTFYLYEGYGAVEYNGLDLDHYVISCPRSDIMKLIKPMLDCPTRYVSVARGTCGSLFYPGQEK